MNMHNVEQWIGFLLIGGITGWLAGLIVRGRGFGIAGDILLGIVGALFGGWMAGVLGLTAYTSFGAFITALIGAVALVGLTRFFRLAA